MNVPKAFEIALAKTIREYAEIGEGVTIRAWQALRTDAYWNEDTDRQFPMIDIRCSPPMPDEVQATLVCECGVLMGTNADDDRDHAGISQLYEAVHGLLDTLFSQFRQSESEELAYFMAEIEAALDMEFDLGGFTFGQGLAPNDEGGINMIGTTFRLHYHNAAYDY